MTLPQVVAVLEADDRRQVTDSLRLADAVWAGVAPTVSKEGWRGSRKWYQHLERALRGRGS